MDEAVLLYNRTAEFSHEAVIPGVCVGNQSRELPAVFQNGCDVFRGTGSEEEVDREFLLLGRPRGHGKYVIFRARIRRLAAVLFELFVFFALPPSLGFHAGERRPVGHNHIGFPGRLQDEFVQRADVDLGEVRAAVVESVIADGIQIFEQ